MFEYCMLFHTYVAMCNEKSSFMAMVYVCTGVDLNCFHSRKMSEPPKDLFTPTQVLYPTPNLSNRSQYFNEFLLIAHA